MPFFSTPTGDPASGRLRDLPFMDIYIRMDEAGRGAARYRTPGRDSSNNWSRILPDSYNAEIRIIIEQLRKNIDNPDFSFDYDGVRFRQSYQKFANNQEWVILRRINARVPTLEELSVAPHIASHLRRLGQRDGLILISGPTGHGKTTMSFALLQEYLKSFGGVGITVEDPVEYMLDGAVGDNGYCYQVQVDKEEDWATPLKRALRWTPRYLLVGEVRTPRAAEQILRAATTGHLVITTIHAGSVEESFMGLLHLAEQCVGGAANYMLAQGLTAAWHQTLTPTGPFLRYVFTEEGNNGDPVRALIRENKVGMVNSYVDKQVARMTMLGNAEGAAKEPSLARRELLKGIAMGIDNHNKSFAKEAATDGKRNLIGLSRDEMAEALTGQGLEKFRAKQVWSWIYCRGARDFKDMTDLAKPARDKLADHFIIDRPTVSQHQKSEDGTQKWLLKMADGQEVESVHIPESDRGALCVSSQVGCTLTCRFCHTGTQRLVRNLEPAEIISQVMLARDYLNEWAEPSTSPSGKRRGRKTEEAPVHLLTNIVMMGMGEPLYNYENVAKALRIVMDSDGIAIGKRRITLSTSGVVPMIKRCGEELDVNLAVSLHAVTDELRDQIIPLNRKYPIKELLQACRDYPGASNSRRITFEYVMLKGVNDSPVDAKQLVRLLRGIPAKINLIPFNAWPGSPFECSDWDVIEKFGDIVNEAGYASPIRTPRGRDIMAACGQLKSASLKLSATERAAIDKLIAEKDKAQGLSS